MCVYHFIHISLWTKLCSSDNFKWNCFFYRMHERTVYSIDRRQRIRIQFHDNNILCAFTSFFLFIQAFQYVQSVRRLTKTYTHHTAQMKYLSFCVFFPFSPFSLFVSLSVFDVPLKFSKHITIIIVALKTELCYIIIINKCSASLRNKILYRSSEHRAISTDSIHYPHSIGILLAMNSSERF